MDSRCGWIRGIGIALAAMAGAGCAVPRSGVRSAGLDAGELSAFYSRVAGVVPTPVSTPRFSDGGPAIRAEMLDLIRRAEDHILVGSFLLNDGPVSREILDALADRAGEGVEVRVLGDASSRFVKEEEAFAYLRSRGVSTAEFNPIRGVRLLVPPVLLERDHRKFWIVDGRHVFLGGANLSDSSLTSPKSGGNRDLMVRVDSPPAARMLTRSFVKTWNESDSDGTLDMVDFEPYPAEPDGDLNYWFFNQDRVWSSPLPSAVMLEGLYASAKKSIWLVEPYTFTNPCILGGIRSMTKRGVEVNVVLSSQVRAPRFRYASFYGILDLIEAGAKVWMFDSEVSPLHYKCALVDDRLAYVGSANLNFRSFRLSRELNVVFDDPASVGEVIEVVRSVRKDCREVSAREARAYRSLPFASWWLLMQAAG